MSESIDFLRALQEEIHENNVAHGWADGTRSVGDHIALIHSELSEALEEFRKGYSPDEIYYRDSNGVATEYPYSNGAPNKPEGLPVEIADAVIRCFGMAGELDFDLAAAILDKIQYNTTRSHRHGGKAL